MRAAIVAILFLSSNALAGQPGRVAINVSAGFVQEDLSDLSDSYDQELGPAPSFSAGLEVFNRRHWFSLQAAFTYNHYHLYHATYDQHLNLSTYTPSLMLKVKPIRRTNWLWGGLRIGAVRLTHSDYEMSDGPGSGSGWGYLTQGNIILVITQARHLAINTEVGYQIGHVNNVTFTHPKWHPSPLSYRLNYDLSGPRIALGVSLFP